VSSTPRRILHGRYRQAGQQLRRWKLTTVVLLVAATALMIAGPVVSQQNLVPFDDRGSIQIPANRLAAHDFTLVGKDGKIYGRLFMKGNGPTLQFYNQHGELVWSMPPSRGGYKPVGNGIR